MISTTPAIQWVAPPTLASKNHDELLLLHLQPAQNKILHPVGILYL